MSLDRKTLEIDLYNSFFGVSPEMSKFSPNYSASGTLKKTNKDDMLDEKSKKELDVQVKNMVLSIEKFIKSGTVETSVTVDLTGQTFNTSVGPATAIPLSIVSGDGTGEIK